MLALDLMVKWALVRMLTTLILGMQQHFVLNSAEQFYQSGTAGAGLQFLSPLRGLFISRMATHALRRGLHSFAALGLRSDDFSICVLEARSRTELRSVDSRGRLSPHGHFRNFRLKMGRPGE